MKRDRKEAGFGMEALKLKSEKKIRVLNRVSMEAEIKDNLRVLSGMAEIEKWRCCEIPDEVE